MGGLRVDGALPAYFLGQIVAQVERCMKQYAALQRVFRDAGTLGQQFAAAIGTIAAHHHLVPLAHIERFSVRHAEDMHLLPVGLGEIYFVVNTHCRVEVEGKVFEACALLVVGSRIVQAQGMVVRRRHGVAPHVVAELQMPANLLTGHA